MKLCGVVVVFNPENKVNENIKSYLNDLEKLYVIDNSTNIINKYLFFIGYPP